MTRGIAGPLPFAFILAMAADAASGVNSEVTNPSKPLELGALSGLLAAIDRTQVSPALDSGLIQGNVGTKVVQFFPNFPNFRNCFTGTWRNC